MRNDSNRIRHFRRLAGLTQSEVAQQLNTSPATISRLETEDMTVSLDWLRRLAAIFEVPVQDLLARPEQDQIPVLGQLDSRGVLTAPVNLTMMDVFSLEVPARHPVAVRLGAPLGAFRAGAILIGDRHDAPFSSDYPANKTSIVALEHQGITLGRLATADHEGTFTFVPASEAAPPQTRVRPEWAAPLVMCIDYL